jgi:hypothetical protein
MRHLACLLSLTTALPGQLPDGGSVVASFANASNPNGGLFAVDAHGNATAILNLPPELVMANAVLRAPTAPDVPARVVAANLQTTPGGNAWVWDLEIASAGGRPPFVATVRGAHLLGARSSSTNAVHAGVHQAVWLPGHTRVLLATGGIATGRAAGLPLWILDLGTGALTSPPLGAWTGGFNAVTVDAAGTHAYAARFDEANAHPIVEVPLAGPAPRVIATLPVSPTGQRWFATSLFWDCNGTLTATASANPLSTPVGAVVRLTPNPPPQLWNVNVTQLATHPILQAGALDPVTCDLLLVTANAGNLAGMAEVARLRTDGTLSQVSRGPMGGWGSPASLDLDPDPEVYAAATPSPHLALACAFAPFPGGRPQAGNLGFGFALRTTAPPLATVLAVAAAAARPPIPLPQGPLLHLMPPFVLLDPIAGADPFFALPLPAGLQVAGPIFVQAFAVDAQFGLASSQGVALTLQ